MTLDLESLDCVSEVEVRKLHPEQLVARELRKKTGKFARPNSQLNIYLFAVISQKTGKQRG